MTYSAPRDEGHSGTLRPMFAPRWEISRWSDRFDRWIRDEGGQSMIEYALLAGIIAVAAITVLQSIRENLVGVFETVNDSLASADVGDAG